MHFANAGAYILTLSAIAGGLLLCTEYTLLRISMRVLRVPIGGAVMAGRTVVKRRGEKAPLAKTDLEQPGRVMASVVQDLRRGDAERWARRTAALDALV